MAIWGRILDRFEQLVRQIRPQGHPDAMAGVLDPRNAEFDGKIAWVCATGPWGKKNKNPDFGVLESMYSFTMLNVKSVLPVLCVEIKYTK